MSKGAGRVLGWYARGFADPYLRRMIEAAGFSLGFGPTTKHLDAVAVWGARPVAQRGARAAVRRGVPQVYFEDAFLRAVRPDRKEPPVGITIDHRAPYFDAATPSDLEALLASAPTLSDAERLRAQDVMGALRAHRLSRFNDGGDVPHESGDGYVLVVDQLKGDAAIERGGACAARFATMLAQAKAEHPNRAIMIRAHPRVGAGHFSPVHGQMMPEGVNIHDALAHAHAVYTVTSQVGFEAIVHGHRPVVFGAPFYAGWGLSDDRAVKSEALTRRGRAMDRETLFHRAFIDYPFWFDPAQNRQVEAEEAIEALAVRKRQFGWQAAPPIVSGVRRWKRARTRAFLGACQFVDPHSQADSQVAQTRRRLVSWGARKGTNPAGWSMEDGFLRSRGIGAKLVPPLSLCLDAQGIYFDTARPNDLADLIAASSDLSATKLARARRLRERICAAGLSKYNRGQAPETKADILVVGQVEDDASVRLGGGAIKSNSALLAAARAANPQAVIAYKPHPDVEQGLRDGRIQASGADFIWQDADPIAAIKAAGEVWTMTSLLGFEALLHGVKTTCTGCPFYGGWGLTQDVTKWRHGANSVTIDGLVHAVLIDYPIYYDPVSRLGATPEAIVERLASGYREEPLGRGFFAWLQALSGWRPKG